MNMPPVTPEELLAVGLRRCDPPVAFSGGQKANNKAELDHANLRQHPLLLGRVVSQLCDLVQPYEPEFISAVPDGATGYIDLVAIELSRREDRDVFGVYLKKCKDRDETFQYASEIDVNTIQRLGRGALLEDAINRRTNTRKALQVVGMRSKIVMVAAILDRGISGEYDEVDVPVKHIAKRPIKAILPKHSPYRRYLK